MAGQGWNDMKLAGRVRTKALKEIEKILDDEELKVYSKDYRQQIVLKLAGTLLPRLNEHQGKDGKDLVIKFDKSFSQDNQEENESIQQTTSDSGEQETI